MVRIKYDEMATAWLASKYLDKFGEVPGIGFSEVDLRDRLIQALETGEPMEDLSQSGQVPEDALI